MRSLSLYRTRNECKCFIFRLQYICVYMFLWGQPEPCKHNSLVYARGVWSRLGCHYRNYCEFWHHLLFDTMNGSIKSLTNINAHLAAHTHTRTDTQRRRGRKPFSMSCCDVITFHLMWKIIQSQWDGKCSAVYHRNWHCLLPLQHIICSISQSQLFSLSYCHTHSATVYHMPHLTRHRCAHACVRPLLFLLLHCVFCLFVFIWMSVGVWMHQCDDECHSRWAMLTDIIVLYDVL